LKGFGAILAAELRDLVRAPLFWLGAAGTVAAAFGFGRRAPASANGWVAYESAVRASGLAATFFLLGLSAVSVAGERARGTVRWVLPRPVSRAAFVLGKGAAIAIAAFFLLALSSLTSLAVAGPRGFGDVAVDAGSFEFVDEIPVDPEFAAPAMRGRAIQTTLVLFPALLTAAGLGLVVSCLSRSGGAAVIVALAVAVPLHLAPAILGLSRDVARLLPFGAADEFLSRLRDFGMAMSSEKWPRYGAAGLAAGAMGAIGLPLLGAAFFSRLDVTD